MAAMKEYEASADGEANEKAEKGEKKKKEAKKEVSPNKSMAGTTFKSKEYISDDDSSSGEDVKVQ